MQQNGQFWLADSGENQLLHFTSVDQLPVKNYTSDATQPALSPRSAFVDRYNNLLVADGINRLLFFAPALGVVNAANFIAGRPLAPEPLPQYFPAVSTNIIASGTDSAASYPLPTGARRYAGFGKRQCVASVLRFSGADQSPALHEFAASGGTVDIQVVRQSTGQIYGGAEVSLNISSPGIVHDRGYGYRPGCGPQCRRRNRQLGHEPGSARASILPFTEPARASSPMLRRMDKPPQVPCQRPLTRRFF